MWYLLLLIITSEFFVFLFISVKLTIEPQTRFLLPDSSKWSLSACCLKWVSNRPDMNWALEDQRSKKKGRALKPRESWSRKEVGGTECESTPKQKKQKTKEEERGGWENRRPERKTRKRKRRGRRLFFPLTRFLCSTALHTPFPSGQPGGQAGHRRPSFPSPCWPCWPFQTRSSSGGRTPARRGTKGERTSSVWWPGTRSPSTQGEQSTAWRARAGAFKAIVFRGENDMKVWIRGGFSHDWWAPC